MREDGNAFNILQTKQMMGKLLLAEIKVKLPIKLFRGWIAVVTSSRTLSDVAVVVSKDLSHKLSALKQIFTTPCRDTETEILFA